MELTIMNRVLNNHLDLNLVESYLGNTLQISSKSLNTL